jgi:hypothetical protein
MRPDEEKPDMRRERRTSQLQMTKSISIKTAERKSGGCAWKAVELTSGDLRVAARKRGWGSREATRTRRRSQQRA